MSRILVFLFSVLVIVCACDSQVDPETVQKSEILHVYSEGRDAIFVGGRDTVVVVARIPKLSVTRTVDFKTTMGAFVFTNEKTIKARADSIVGNYRFARVQMRSDTTAGTAYVTAVVGEFHHTITIAIQ